MSKHLPMIAWSRQELMNELWQHEAAIRNLQKELDRRSDRDDQRFGYPVAIYDKPGVIFTGYRHFKTQQEAWQAALEEFPQDRDAAPYKVHPVYLGKDDPE